MAEEPIYWLEVVKALPSVASPTHIAAAKETVRSERQYVRREPQDWGWSQDSFSWGWARPNGPDRYEGRRYVEDRPQFFQARRRPMELPNFFQWR